MPNFDAFLAGAYGIAVARIAGSGGCRRSIAAPACTSSVSTGVTSAIAATVTASVTAAASVTASVSASVASTFLRNCFRR